ncbi:hypothetical protein [Streptomyces sp. NPDC002573]|uniref:hypothetical protein n=1 Tax=Streptomyces sp. NPDC002573 TaxID=3364651 RepID=UPI0036B27CE4
MAIRLAPERLHQVNRTTRHGIAAALALTTAGAALFGVAELRHAQTPTTLTTQNAAAARQTTTGTVLATQPLTIRAYNPQTTPHPSTQLPATGHTLTSPNQVTIDCYYIGQAVPGLGARGGPTDSYWDRLSGPGIPQLPNGSVPVAADAWIDTGADVTTRVGPCTDAPASPQQATTPVKIPLTQDANVSAGLDRNNDQSPFAGGGSLYYQVNGGPHDGGIGRCTTGFGVHSTVDNRTYLLTAGHCAAIGRTTFHAQHNGTSDIFGNWHYDKTTVGTFTHADASQDIAMIEAPSTNTLFDGGGAPNAFQGDWRLGDGMPVAHPGTVDTRRTFLKPVDGISHPGINDTVCVSGSATGVACGLKIAATGISVTYQDDNDQPYAVHGLIAAEVPAGQQTATHGDSGGPVFTLNPTNGHAYAAGTISGDCTDAIPASVKKPGAWYLCYAPMDAYSNTFHITVNTPTQPPTIGPNW